MQSWSVIFSKTANSLWPLSLLDFSGNLVDQQLLKQLFAEVEAMREAAG